MSYKITADITLLDKPASLSLEVGMDSANPNMGEGSLTFLDGPLDLNDTLDRMLSDLGMNSSPFGDLPTIVLDEFDLISFDNGADGSGMILEAHIEVGGMACVARYGVYSPLAGQTDSPESFSLILEPFVIESIPGINLQLNPPFQVDLHEVGYVTKPYKDENGADVAAGTFIRAAAGGAGIPEMELVYPWIEGDDEVQSRSLEPVSRSTDPSPTEHNTDDGLVSWFELNKVIGPAKLKQVGLKWKEGKVTALVNADISFGGITLGLQGFQATVEANIPPGWPSFGIDGLGLSFDSGGIEVAGAFLKGEPDPTLGITDQYEGAVKVKFEELLLYGMGSYAKVHGHDSIFAYVYVGYPIGGPPFFFVEGLALGFGYNRGFNLPPLDQVDTFPLVEQAMAPTAPANMDDPMAMLAGMDYAIPPQEGAMLLAVGIKFNTFGVLDSFALLAVSFGDRTRFDLIGLSQLTLPPEDPVPVVYVEVALEASLEPDKGVLEVNGLLTDHSYVYSKDAHLTGGFAFYSWFKDQDNGAKAGDFVLSMGGYHPDFRKPDHYPAVPRLALNWRVDSHLDIQGEGYFAMTPQYAMAGFQITATYEDGSLKAVFSEGADFLIQWKPFHYDITAYISIRASATVKVNLVLTTVHKTFHLDLGADIHIWGPDFSGHADIHVKVLGVGFSFGVDFGAGAGPPPPLIWSEFKEAFLPEPSKVLSISASEGLLKTVDDEWVFNAKEMVIQVNTAVPVTKVNSSVTGASFPVGPMQLASGAFTSELTLTLTDGDGNSALADIEIESLDKNMPKALWGDYNPSPDLNDNDSLTLLSGGVEIRVKPPVNVPASKLIDAEKLAFEQPFDAAHNHWSYGDSNTDDFDYDNQMFTTYLPDYQLADFAQMTMSASALQEDQTLLATPVMVDLV